MKKVLLWLINLAIIIVTIIGGIKFFENFSNHRTANETYSTLQDISSTTKTSKENIEPKFDKLHSLNPDYKFWITIENTNVDYPVVQGNDNSFYLNNDFYKNPLVYGSIFLDYTNNFEKDINTILYGHNTKTNSMFSQITKFKKEDFFNQSNKIILEDANFKYIYDVFSVYTIRGYDDPSYLYSLNSKEYINESEKFNFLTGLSKKSFYNKDIDFKDTNSIITLITCSYEAQNTRTVIHAKLLDKQPIK